MRGGPPLPVLLRPLRLGAQRVERAGGGADAGGRNQREGADRAPPDRRRAEDCG